MGKAKCHRALLLKLCIAFGACVTFASSALHAQTVNEIKKSTHWAKAAVVTDGGSVYSKPDFDAPVADYLPFKTKIWLTKKAVPGNGGLGLFHRVRYKDKSGYMVDTDIRLLNKADKDDTPIKKSSPPSEEAKKEEALDQPPPPIKEKRKEAAKKKDDDEAPKGKQSLYFKRYIGAALAMVDFTEKFSGQKLSDHMTMYGLRMSGPGTLFDGPPLDVNIWFSLQKPGYYSTFAATPPQGFLTFGDIMANLPFYEWKNTMINYGVGLMWTYTNYKVQVKNSHFDSQELRVGLDFDLGVTQRIGHYAIKLDAKYYYEKTQYLGYVGSFQMEY